MKLDVIKSFDMLGLRNKQAVNSMWCKYTN